MFLYNLLIIIPVSMVGEVVRLHYFHPPPHPDNPFIYHVYGMDLADNLHQAMRNEIYFIISYTLYIWYQL